VYTQDQRAARQSHRLPHAIEIKGVHIAPDDLIFGNREGKLVIPADVEGEAAAAALAKASTENKIATAIRGGMSAREAFEIFGVL
jgi:regulator of RNase E activity RraA